MLNLKITAKQATENFEGHLMKRIKLITIFSPNTLKYKACQEACAADQGME